MIPKIIHCCWAQGSKTKLAEKCLASWRKFAPGLLAMVVGVYLLNRWCVPFADDWLYALEGENTALEGTAHHVASFADVVRIQLNDYVKGPNGRVFLHAVVTAFCALGWQEFFDLLNTGMWFLLVSLIMRECGIRHRFLACSALTFAFLWRAETCCVNAAFAVNYLWSACVTIVFLRLWRRADAAWLIPVAFLFGWWQEAFSLPMVAALGATCLIRSLSARRFAWGGLRTCAYLALVLGTVGCIGGHFFSGRVIEPASKSFVFLLVLAFWPAVLLMCLTVLSVRNRRCLGAWVEEDCEWWMYFCAGAGMFALIGNQGLRLAMPMLLAALILCLKHRTCLAPLRKLVPMVVAFAFVWLSGGAVVQYRQMAAFEEMVDVYRKDPQGLTFRRPVATGLWDGTVSPLELSRYYRGILRHVCEKDVPPIVLSPSVYDEVMDSASSNRTFVLERKRKTGWRRFLPGRCGRMFPNEDFHMGLPSDRVEVTDPSGHCVTLIERDE